MRTIRVKTIDINVSRPVNLDDLALGRAMELIKKDIRATSHEFRLILIDIYLDESTGEFTLSFEQEENDPFIGAHRIISWINRVFTKRFGDE